MLARAWERLGRVLAAIVRSRLFKPALFVICLVPGVLLGYDLWRFFIREEFDALGVDPNLTVLHETGETALRILIASLAVTPLRRLFRIPKLQLVRRMLGVWAFVYALLHLSAYLIFDQLCYSFATCQFGAIPADIVKRPFILMGMTAFSVLLALTLTSTTGWQRRLRKNWTRLHRLVYLAVVAAIIHFIWIQKSDYREPLKWGAVVALLLGVRLFYAVRARTARRQAVASS